MARETLLASANRNTGGNAVVGTPVMTFGSYRSAMISLVVTSAATLAGDTLDVYIQKNVGPEDSPVWHDFVHFTQVLGNGGAKTHVAQVASDDITTPMGALKDAALAAGVESGPWSDRWRVKWVVAGTGNFTFAVYAQLQGC